MKTNGQKLAGLAGAAALCIGMSGAQAAPAPTLHYSDYAGAPVQSFNAFGINGFEAVGNNAILVWTGVNRAYLLKVWDSCFRLPFTEHIRIDAIGSEVTRLDTVMVGRERCPISEIRPVDIKRMRADRAALRTKARQG